MTTALMISQMLELHDDALIADIDQAFTEIDREVERSRREDHGPLLLIVDELVDELLAPAKTDELSIELELELEDRQAEHADLESSDVAEVA